MFLVLKEHGEVLKHYSDNRFAFLFLPSNELLPIMISLHTPVYLASKSPRRRNMLNMMGINFTAVSIDMDEVINENQSPVENVKRIALEKCNLALAEIDEGIVITADTIVVIDGNIIGKPNSKAHAKKILNTLSGKSHFVYTGFSISNKNKNKTITDYSKTKVTFKKLTAKEISDYIKTGSPMDKAGAYGIQDDFGAVFVEKISGCYYNVIGFPVSKIYQALKKIA